jgi:hypothetical protein
MIKIKKGVSENIIYIIGLIVLTALCFACQKNNKDVNNREIIIINGCDEDEALHDMNYSVDELNEYFSKNKIKISEKDSSNWCGYILKNGTSIKEIKTVISSVDLLNECNDFFDIK